MSSRFSFAIFFVTLCAASVSSAQAPPTLLDNKAALLSGDEKTPPAASKDAAADPGDDVKNTKTPPAKIVPTKSSTADSATANDTSNGQVFGSSDDGMPSDVDSAKEGATGATSSAEQPRQSPRQRPPPAHLSTAEDAPEAKAQTPHPTRDISIHDVHWTAWTGIGIVAAAATFALVAGTAAIVGGFIAADIGRVRRAGGNVSNGVASKGIADVVTGLSGFAAATSLAGGAVFGGVGLTFLEETRRDVSTKPPLSDSAKTDDAKADAKTDDTKTGDAKTGDAKTDDAKTDGAKTDGAKTDDEKTDGAKTDGARTDDAKTDDAKTDDAKTDDAKTDDTKTDDAKTDDDKRETPKAPAKEDAKNVKGGTTVG